MAPPTMLNLNSVWSGDTSSTIKKCFRFKAVWTKQASVRTAEASNTVWHHSQQFFSSTRFLFMLGVKKNKNIWIELHAKTEIVLGRELFWPHYILHYIENARWEAEQNVNILTHTRFPRRKQMTPTLPRSLLAFVSRRIYLHKTTDIMG